MIDYVEENARVTDRRVDQGWRWGTPLSAEECQEIRQGRWTMVLTPTKPVPRRWFPPLAGCRVLGLAAGGGQQMPFFCLSGARGTVMDSSTRQLEMDRMVADREGYRLEIVRGDMSKPFPFGDEAFDLVVNPVSLCYVESVLPVWRECFRVLRPGGVLLAGLDNGLNYIFDEDERAVVRGLPFNPLKDRELYDVCAREDAGVQFSHTAEELIGGLLEAGFLLTDFYEDTNGEGRLHELGVPTCFAVRAVKPGQFGAAGQTT